MATGITRWASSGCGRATSPGPGGLRRRTSCGTRSRRWRSSGWPRGRSAAVTGIDRGGRIAETWDQWTRARLLPAQVEIAIAAGDVAKARAAAEELTQLTSSYSSPATEATLHEAWGRVLLAEQDAPGAAARLRAAVRTWRGIVAAV